MSLNYANAGRATRSPFHRTNAGFPELTKRERELRDGPPEKPRRVVVEGETGIYETDSDKLCIGWVEDGKQRWKTLDHRDVTRARDERNKLTATAPVPQAKVLVARNEAVMVCAKAAAMFLYEEALEATNPQAQRIYETRARALYECVLEAGANAPY